MSDKPTIHSTAADLDTEGKPEAYVHATRAGKRVTFPDVFDMEFEEAERFLDDLNGDQSNSAVLKKWLSEKDYEALRADKLSLRGIGILLQKVMNHYQGTVGTPGEGDASKN